MVIYGPFGCNLTPNSRYRMSYRNYGAPYEAYEVNRQTYVLHKKASSQVHDSLGSILVCKLITS